MQCRSRSSYAQNDFFGVDTENMSPQARIVMGLSVLIPVALGIAVVLFFFQPMFWLVFTFGWMVFPAFGLLTGGLSGLASSPSGKQLEHASTASKERELLEALRDLGELTPAQAAMETSLSVSEADEKLKELAEGGHLEVRVRGGGLFYALWNVDEIE
ncbi:MAG: helix-turn-helix transcriptional regulator [Rubrobacteraceae bacterium]